jgi:hypothetical protein
MPDNKVKIVTLDLNCLLSVACRSMCDDRKSVKTCLFQEMCTSFKYEFKLVWNQLVLRCTKAFLKTWKQIHVLCICAFLMLDLGKILNRALTKVTLLESETPYHNTITPVAIKSEKGTLNNIHNILVGFISMNPWRPWYTVIIGPQHPLVRHKRRLNGGPWRSGLKWIPHIPLCVVRSDWMGAVLRMRPEKPRPRVTDPFLLKGLERRAQTLHQQWLLLHIRGKCLKRTLNIYNI